VVADPDVELVQRAVDLPDVGPGVERRRPGLGRGRDHERHVRGRQPATVIGDEPVAEGGGVLRRGAQIDTGEPGVAVDADGDPKMERILETGRSPHGGSPLE
jgi:hypothetical protein